MVIMVTVRRLSGCATRYTAALSQTAQHGAGSCAIVGFKGDYFCMPRGASYATVPEEFNDKISSIRVF